MVEAVLRAGYPVLLYQGVYDARDGPACNEAWMRSIDWDHIKNFWDSEREVWRVNRRLAGYWRRWKNLSHVVVQGAGHQVRHSHPTKFMYYVYGILVMYQIPKEVIGIESFVLNLCNGTCVFSGAN